MGTTKQTRGQQTEPALSGASLKMQEAFSGSDTNNSSIESVQSGLIEYGYNLRKTRMWDEATQKVIIAFQRHFRPSTFDGVWDEECALLLKALLKNTDF